jgi:hypothetical protein
MIRILSVDPSVNHIGWCLKEGDEWIGGTIETDPDSGIHYRLKLIKRELTFGVKINQIVYEMPEFMGSTAGKIASQKGYTINLGLICGFVLGTFPEVSPHDMFGYLPKQWKGTVPKKATEAKYYRTFGSDIHPPPSEHEIDATMMLYHHCDKMGLLPRL